jgi:hypothetical protein
MSGQHHIRRCVDAQLRGAHEVHETGRDAGTNCLNAGAGSG